MKYIKKYAKYILALVKFLRSCIEDILIISGLIVIIKATFLLSKIAGLYVTGLILLGLGVYFSKYPFERR